MIRKAAVILFELSLLGTTLPSFGGEKRAEPVQATTTERMSFAPGGTIRVDDSYGSLNVEGWDQPEVEITVLKSMPFDYERKRPEEAAKHLERVRVTTERSSGNELKISTVLPARTGLLSPLSHKTKGDVMIEYEIHVPRDSKLIVHHGTGSVVVADVAGDIEASGGRGDIVLMLRDAGAYQIDARSRFGTVISDFEGTAHVTRYRMGERYITASSQASRRLFLRMGFGGITIKAVPKEAFAASAAKSL